MRFTEFLEHGDEGPAVLAVHSEAFPGRVEAGIVFFHSCYLYTFIFISKCRSASMIFSPVSCIDSNLGAIIFVWA